MKPKQAYTQTDVDEVLGFLCKYVASQQLESSLKRAKRLGANHYQQCYFLLGSAWEYLQDGFPTKEQVDSEQEQEQAIASGDSAYCQHCEVSYALPSRFDESRHFAYCPSCKASTPMIRNNQSLATMQKAGYHVSKLVAYIQPIR